MNNVKNKCIFTLVFYIVFVYIIHLCKKVKLDRKKRGSMMLDLGRQFFRFSIVGVLSFGIDYGLLLVLTEIMDMHYLISATGSFMAATVFNYIYSMKYVFYGRENMRRSSQFTIFLILSLCGLGMNTMLLRWMVEHSFIHYMKAKILTTLIVSIYNFVTRKLFLEETEGMQTHKRAGIQV